MVSLPDDGRITGFAAIHEIPDLFMKEETPFPYLQKKRGIFWKIIGMDLSDLHSRKKIPFVEFPAFCLLTILPFFAIIINRYIDIMRFFYEKR